jgi:hypothetical protein
MKQGQTQAHSPSGRQKRSESKEEHTPHTTHHPKFTRRRNSRKNLLDDATRYDFGSFPNTPLAYLDSLPALPNHDLSLAVSTQPTLPFSRTSSQPNACSNSMARPTLNPSQKE